MLPLNLMDRQPHKLPVHLLGSLLAAPNCHVHRHTFLRTRLCTPLLQIQIQLMLVSLPRISHVDKQQPSEVSILASMYSLREL